MEKSEDLVWYILYSSAFTAFVVMLFSVLIYKQFKLRGQQREDFEKTLNEKELELINAIVKAQEAERTQIARNLHDEVGSKLSMSQQKLSQASSYFQSNSDAVQEILAVTNMIEQSVSSLRAITNGMLPHYLLNFGLSKSVDRLFEHAQESIGKPCLVIHPLVAILTKEQEIQIYYIISELLNNLIKHAKPDFIDGSFTEIGGQVSFTINHDGVAISQSEYEHFRLKNSGIGLSSIAHRVAFLKGSLNFERGERGGNISLIVPHENQLFKV